MPAAFCGSHLLPAPRPLAMGHSAIFRTMPVKNGRLCPAQVAYSVGGHKQGVSPTSADSGEGCGALADHKRRTNPDARLTEARDARLLCACAGLFRRVWSQCVAEGAAAGVAHSGRRNQTNGDE
jgi:hypothetical protein